MTVRDPDLARLLTKYEVDQSFDPYRFVPPGPIARAFIVDDTTLSPFLMGPVGAGKTVTCAMKRIVSATRMPPCSDGVIRDRFVVVRSTYRDAERTVLASWNQWFPRTYPGSSWTGGNDRPAIHTLRFRDQKGRRVEAITEFIGLNGQRVEDRLRGYEISGAWMNEADTLDEDALRYLEQRTGRYPKKDLLPPGEESFRLVMGDLNAPDIDNWVYSAYVEAPSANRVLYAQPSGMSAEAENVQHLPADYYTQMVADNEDWFVQRMVHNKFGYSRDGKPVYDTFNPRVHVSNQRLIYNRNADLLIGLDGGAGTLKPAAVFGQIHAGWQLRILGEVVPGHGFGPTRFGEMLVGEIEREFPGARLRAWGDPSIARGADREGGELTWGEIVSTIINTPILIPFGGSNEIALRTDAVKAELKTDGTTPNMIIDGTRCPRLVRGFASTYRFKKRAVGSADYEPTPDKLSPEDDVHNAHQYLVGGVRGRQAIVRGGDQRRRERLRDEGEQSGWANGGSVSRGSAGQGGKPRGFDVHKV